jgi:hypothetical protein
MDNLDDIDGDAVLGLIGSSASVRSGAFRSGRDDVAIGADDLIASLYRQYCLVLDDPYASLTDDTTARASTGEPDIVMKDLSAHPTDQAVDERFIKALLSGPQRIEQVFGDLGTGEALEFPATDLEGDILHLFAPAEFHAAASRRPAALPPELARRDHHAIGIDSSLSMPLSRPPDHSPGMDDPLSMPFSRLPDSGSANAASPCAMLTR